MKILIISNMYPSKEKPYSGIFVKNQYEYLKSELGEDIDIYAMRRKMTSKIGSVFKYLIFYLKFFSLLRRQYDIIHVHFFGYHIFLAYLYKLVYYKTKILVTFHGGDIKNIDRYLFKLFLKKLNLIIVVGKEQFEYISKKSNVRVKLLPAGVDERIFYRRDNIQKKYDFIFVGSFYHIKGIDIFCEAIKLLDNRKLRYCFVGSGNYEPSILELKQRYNIDFFKNQTQNQIATLLNSSKFLVLPSRGDSFGLVVSEAIFCGTPVLVSNIGGMRQQVVDGFNGFILKENTPEELAKKMRDCYGLESDIYRSMVKNCLNSNREFSLKSVCSELSNIYRRVYNERK